MNKQENNFSRREMLKRRVLVGIAVVLMGVSLVFTSSATAHSNPAPPVPQGEIKGQIRWKKDMGLIPIGPGKLLASNSACSPFFIVAYQYNASFSGGSKIIAYTSRSISQPKEQEGYYVCDYSMQVPLNKSIFVRAGMGDVDLLLKMSREPEVGINDQLPSQPYYLTDPWIGGTNSRPPAGRERGFVERPTGGSKYLEFVIFEMVYVKKAVNPNPKPESSAPLSEEGAPPSRVPAHWFAGAWRGKLGESYLELVLQQSGSQVTGQINLNSTIYVVKGGRADGNTLRFQVVRPSKPIFNGRMLPDEVLGTGELVMDEGGKTFTGKMLNADASGTLINR